MKTRRANRNVILAIILIVSLCALLILSRNDRLDVVEIREYQGQRLSSINDIQNNEINGTQKIDAESYRLTISGFGSDKSYSYYDVIDNFAHRRKVVTLHCVEGWSATILWEGVLLKDLLSESNASTVIFYASDGYSTSLPLDYVKSNNILLAFKMNGATIPPEKGFPFQLVAESKYGYKWIKWVTRIELSNASYAGYWESRGYSNDADVE